MSESEKAIAARTRLWSTLKPLLIRTLGYEGASAWLHHAGNVMAMEAKRHANTKDAPVEGQFRVVSS